MRLEDELGLRLEPATEELVRAQAGRAAEPAGERILGELLRLSAAGYRRAAGLGLLEALGGSTDGLDRSERVDSPEFRLVCALGESVERLPIANGTRRYARTLLRARPPRGSSPREIFRFRRATEPWALDALAFAGASRYADAVLAAREREPKEPLLRGDELGIAPGPEVGRLLALVAEERAVGTISSREEALELVRRELR